MADSSYAEIRMKNQRSAEESAAFGPEPELKAEKPVEAKWRPEEALYNKVIAITVVEACRADIRTKKESKVSLNRQLTFIARQFVETYEEAFGPLPTIDRSVEDLEDLKADPSIRRYAEAAERKK